MNRRDRAYYQFASWIFKVPLGVYAALNIGGIALGLGACWFGQPIRPNIFKKPAVFLAAPVRSMEMGGTTLASIKANCPPPYSNVVPVKLQLRHKTPSRAYREPTTTIPSAAIALSGGTTGTAPSTLIIGGVGRLVDSCANVEVWFPTTNMESAPSPNDSTDRVVFRISPPTKDSCGQWRYHYGRP